MKKRSIIITIILVIIVVLSAGFITYQKVEKSKDKLYDNLTIISNTKKYLESNSKYWSTKDGKLFFQDINIMTGYYNLRNELDI